MSKKIEAIQYGTVDPTAVTPDSIGQVYLNTTDGSRWVAYSTTEGEWNKQSGENTGDETAISIKTALGISTLSGSNTGDQTLPVKASGAEIDTGEDDAKFATAKAIKDSKLSYIDGIETLTNKRITQRVVTATDDATAVIDVDVTDQYQLTAIANDTEFSVTGNPTNGQKLLIRYVDAGTTKNLTYATDTFRVIGVTLPTATVANKTGYIGCVYNSAISRFDVVAVGLEA